MYTGEGVSKDYTISTNEVVVQDIRPQPQNVQPIFCIDSIAQEPNETFTLWLKPKLPLPTEDSVNEMNMVILDSDSKTNG